MLKLPYVHMDMCFGSSKVEVNNDRHIVAWVFFFDNRKGLLGA